jgi:hypothetical protein
MDPVAEWDQVWAAWWQEKQDEVMDKSRCRVVAHDQSLHTGFAAFTTKPSVYLVLPQMKTGGSAGGDRIWTCREASMSGDTRRDRGACDGRTRTVVNA